MNPEAIQIKQTVMRLLNVPESSLKNRHRQTIIAKSIIVNLCRSKYGMTQQELAHLVELTNHATVLHHLNKHEDLMQFDKSYRDTYYDCAMAIEYDLSKGNTTDYARLYEIRKPAYKIYDSTLNNQEAVQLYQFDLIKKLRDELNELRVLTDNLKKRCDELTTLTTLWESEL